MAAPVAEHVVDIVQTIAPVVLGVLFIVLGLINDLNMALIGLGAGLLGVPGITQSVQSARANTKAGEVSAGVGGGAHEG